MGVALQSSIRQVVGCGLIMFSKKCLDTAIPIHVHYVDADSHQVVMMSLCCMFMVLMLTMPHSRWR